MTNASGNSDTVGPKRSGQLADMVAVSEAPSLRETYPPATLIRMGVVLAMVVAMNYRQFGYLLQDWIDNPNWSHGFLIPLFSLYLLYARRAELLSAGRRTFLPGLVVVLGACAMQAAAYWIQNPWTCQLSMVFLLFGLVLYLAGPEVIRLTWLPILFLVFALPIPFSIYTRISLPLQNFAAKGAEMLLRLLAVKISVTASNLDVTSISGKIHPLTVAEACSGMRLLMAFLALSVAMAYLVEDRPIWQRVVMVAMGVPIAIFCNVLRVAITCGMCVIDRPELGQKFMHDFTGMLVLIPAFVLLWLLGKFLSALYVEEDDDDSSQDAATSAGGRT